MNLVHYLDPASEPVAKTACGLPTRNGQLILSGRPLGLTVIRAATTCDPCRFALGMEFASVELIANPFLDLPPDNSRVEAPAPEVDS